MSFDTTIKKLREHAGKSQQDIADAIGIARATYAGLETSRTSPSLDIITKIAHYYQLEPAALVQDTVPQPTPIITPHDFTDDSEEILPRDISPQTNPEKLREVLLYVLGKVGAKPNVGETVLYKLLYFIDFDYYEKNGQSITGLSYMRNHFGPTPSIDFKQVVSGMEQNQDLEIIETKYFSNTQKKYLPNKTASLRLLSANELQHIDETLARLSDKTATELSELSHLDTPWRVAQQGMPIDYRFVFYRSDATAVTEPEDAL